MFALVLVAVIGAGDEPTKSNPSDRVSLDGNWTVVCMERDGTPVPEAKDKSVSFRNNTVSFTGPDSKSMKSMRVEFGVKGTVRVTEMAADSKDSTGTSTAEDTKAGKDAKMGHYILTKDYLAICLKDTSHRTGSEVKPASGTTTDTSFETAQPDAKSSCTIILKRSDSGSERRP